MCIIVDNSCSADITSNKPYASLIKEWVEDGGRVVTGGKLLDEVSGTTARELLELWRANNRLILLDREKVEAEEQAVGALPHASNDEHVLAIARLSRSRVLVTKDADL